MQVFFSDTAKKSFHLYIERYLDRFLDLYTDTGLGSAEMVIRENYIQNARLLSQSIHELVISRLGDEVIFGCSYDSRNKIYETTASLGSRRVFITYTENIEKQERVVKDIEIWRK